MLACHLAMLQHFVVYVHQKIHLIIDDLRKKSSRPAGGVGEFGFLLELWPTRVPLCSRV